MNGPQDLGGRMGFGPVIPEADEPVFHADWEQRALGLTLCCGALSHWTLDESRHARETLPPDLYLRTSYYEIWTRALEKLLLRHGELTPDELSAGQALNAGRRTDRRLPADQVAKVLASGSPTDREAQAAARFAVGDRVRTYRETKTTHTRLPDYARDKPGTIEAVHPPHVFPDTNAHGQGENPQWLYTVTFDGVDLFGSASRGTTVSIDAWESYLEPA